MPQESILSIPRAMKEYILLKYLEIIPTHCQKIDSNTSSVTDYISKSNGACCRWQVFIAYPE